MKKGFALILAVAAAAAVAQAYAAGSAPAKSARRSQASEAPCERLTGASKTICLRRLSEKKQGGKKSYAAQTSEAPAEDKGKTVSKGPRQTRMERRLGSRFDVPASDVQDQPASSNTRTPSGSQAGQSGAGAGQALAGAAQQAASAQTQAACMQIQNMAQRAACLKKASAAVPSAAAGQGGAGKPTGSQNTGGPLPTKIGSPDVGQGHAVSH